MSTKTKATPTKNTTAADSSGAKTTKGAMTFDKALTLLKTRMADEDWMAISLLNGLGTKDRGWYVTRFFQLLTKSPVEGKVFIAMMDVLREQKNVKRIEQGSAQLPDTVPQHYKDTFKWLVSNTTTSTQNQGAKICCQKIPPTFPDFISYVMMRRYAVDEDVGELFEMFIDNIWASSLYFVGSLRAAQKTAEKQIWESWRDPKDKKKMLEFDEDIHDQGMGDKVLLLNRDCTPFIPKSFTVADAEKGTKRLMNEKEFQAAENGGYERETLEEYIVKFIAEDKAAEQS